MISSILDNDLYKFTTSYAYMRKFPHAIGTFEFIDRNKRVYNEKFLNTLNNALCNLSAVYMSGKELQWAIRNIPFIPRWYWEWLKDFRYNPEEINTWIDQDSHLRITATGPLYKVTLWEIAILSTVSELSYNHVVLAEGIIDRLSPKIVLANDEGLKFSEFGTRRRYSYYVQDTICKYLSENARQSCVGTSNCHFAMKYGMRPMGTHPHEWFMFHGAQFGYRHANYLALENWQEVYDGDLGIALTDTYTSKLFLNNFSKKHAKLFDGVRHDSGDPFIFTNNVIDRYVQHGIDPRTKTIIFSDALTFPKAVEIKNYCANRIGCSFGIGTNLTNDVGYDPLNIVMKLTRCKMNDSASVKSCVKLSDAQGKYTGDNTELHIAELSIL